MKNIYCTLDTETFGGAAFPKGIYHLAGIIHDRQGNILATAFHPELTDDTRVHELFLSL